MELSTLQEAGTGAAPAPAARVLLLSPYLLCSPFLQAACCTGDCFRCGFACVSAPAIFDLNSPAAYPCESIGGGSELGR